MKPSSSLGPGSSPVGVQAAYLQRRTVSRIARAIGLSIVFAVACALLASCNTITSLSEKDDQQEPDVFEKVRSIDLMPRFPDQFRQADTRAGRKPKSTIYPGEADDVARAGSKSSSSASQASAIGDAVELNFENTPVASVAKVVLGDILGLGYVVDARVQGTVSLSSGRPIPKSDVLFALENALRLGGVALIRDNGAYRLMPQADASGAGTVELAERTEAGYGISVVPVQYVSAQTLVKLVDSFGTKQGMIRADASRNLILVQGSGSERRNTVDLLLSFDVDWLKGQSVGLFPVQNSSPEPIIGELEKIIDSGEGGVSQNVIRLQPIARMNAVLAVARNPDMLRRVETWINRLDNTNTRRTAVHVYRAKYGEARQIARVLNDIFGGGGGGGSGSSSALDGSGGSIAPGSGLSSSSSGSSALNRLSAGGQFGQTSGGSGFGGARSSAGGMGTPSGSGAIANAPSSGNLLDGSGGGQFGARGGAAGAGGPIDGVRISADTVNNSLLIYASQEQYELIEQTIRQLDQPQLQVAIDATIAEVTLNDDLQFGVQSYLSSRDFGLKPDTGSVGMSGASALVSSAGDVALNRMIPGFNFLVGSGATPKMIINALHAVTEVKVLSNPSLVAMDNQVATLQVGDEIPIQTGTATVLTGSNTIASTTDYRSTGIILRVVPRVNVNGNVRLEVEQEISNPVNNSGSGSGTNSLTPTVSTRKVRSAVAVASGQTVLLAGLISDTQNRTRNGIPGLDQLPVVGDVFAQTDKSIKRTELIIFIRPQIIRDGKDAHFVAEEVRTKLRGSIGSVESRQGTSSRLR
jgi:general secretion pathway protein D